MWIAIKYQAPAIAWALVIFILCDIPPSSFKGAPAFEGMDKLVHTGLFFVLTVLLFFGRIRQQQRYSYRITTIIKILLLTACFGGAIELLQLEVFTYRSAEWWDLFADMTGTGMGIFSYILLHRSRGNEKY